MFGNSDRPARSFAFARTALGGAMAAMAVYALLVGPLASPCAAFAQSDWDSIVMAANNEGRVVYYTNSIDPINERVKTDFERMYPKISLEATRIVGPPLVARLDQERQSGVDGADIFNSIDIEWVEQRAEKGLIKAPIGPAAKDWPAKYMLGGAGPVIALESMTIPYNVNLVKFPITGYADLLNPELKGRIGLTENLKMASILDWYNFLEQHEGKDFLTKLAAQNPRFYTGGVPAVQAAASGEIAVAAFATTAIPLNLIAQGAPLKIVIPRPSQGIQYGAGVVAWSKRPNAALVFMDYLMSVRGQTVINGKGESASPLEGIPGSLDASSIQPFDPSKYPPDVVQAESERLDQLFKH